MKSNLRPELSPRVDYMNPTEITSKKPEPADRGGKGAKRGQQSGKFVLLGHPRARWCAGFILLLTAVLSPWLVPLFAYSRGEELHSHIILIPFVSLFLLQSIRGALPWEKAQCSWWLLLPLALGVAALALRSGIPSLGENDSYSLVAFAYVSFLCVGALGTLGREWFGKALFPFAFLLFMIPLPDGVARLMEDGLVLASAEVADLLFALFGTPVFRQGPVFQLPGIVIEVARECSGIRSTWVLFITSVLASGLFLRTPWRRVVLVALVFPLGILRNGIRVVVISLLCVHYGARMIDSWVHHKGGPYFFAVTLVFFIVALWLLKRGDRRRASKVRI